VKRRKEARGLKCGGVNETFLGGGREGNLQNGCLGG